MQRVKTFMSWLGFFFGIFYWFMFAAFLFTIRAHTKKSHRKSIKCREKRTFYAEMKCISKQNKKLQFLLFFLILFGFFFSMNWKKERERKNNIDCSISSVEIIVETAFGKPLFIHHKLKPHMESSRSICIFPHYNNRIHFDAMDFHCFCLCRFVSLKKCIRMVVSSQTYHI